MKNIKSVFFPTAGNTKKIFIIAVLIFYSNVEASSPGGGPEGPVRCTVMGEVTNLSLKSQTADVLLKKTYGSTTQMGCIETGAEKTIGQTVTVTLNIKPKPELQVSDVVFVIKGLAPDFSFVGLESYTIESLSGQLSGQWNNELFLLEAVYLVKSYFEISKTVEQLNLTVNSGTTEEKKLNASMLLILLAINKIEIPQEYLKQAFLIALEKSHQGIELGKHIRLIKKNRAELVDLLRNLLDKTVTDMKWPAVQDPYGIIVALGELGSISKSAVPIILNRMNGLHGNEKKDGDILFVEAIHKMRGEEEATRFFLQSVKEKKIRSNEGPLANGMCRLPKTEKQFKGSDQLNTWCTQNNKKTAR